VPDDCSCLATGVWSWDFSLWISRWFGRVEEQHSLIESMPTDIPEAALSAMMSQVQLLWFRTLGNNLKHFKLTLSELASSEADQFKLFQSLEENQGNGSWQHHYEMIKDYEDELTLFAMKVQQQPLDEVQAQQLAQLLEMTRALVYACKTLKDIHQNLERLQVSEDKAANTLFSLQREFHRDFYSRLLSLMLGKHPADYLREELDALHSTNNQHPRSMDTRVYTGADYQGEDEQVFLDDSDTQLSTQLNVSREIHHANKSLLKSLVLWFDVRSLPSDGIDMPPAIEE